MNSDSDTMTKLINRRTFTTFNLGHLITIITLLVSATLVWANFKNKVIDLDFRVTKAESILAIQQSNVYDSNDKMFAAINDLKTQIAMIQTDVSWIKKKTEK